MLSEIETVLTALNAANVRYLVVGGVAVVLHGRLRMTADLDLVVELEAENAARAVTALQVVGFRPHSPSTLQSFADASECWSWIEEQGLSVVSLRTPAHPAFAVELFFSEPFEFDAAFTRAIQVPVGSTRAFVPAIDDLIALERAVGRGQDLDDVAAL